MDAATKQKVTKYEEYINEKLKTAVLAVSKSQQKVSVDITEYSQLKKMIEVTMTQKSKKIKTKVDLGFHCYLQAECENKDFYMIDVGHDFFVEMSGDEACAFIEQKIELLEEKLKVLNQEGANFQGQIRFAMEAIRELTEGK
jgi:prefoldin alpha subunit